MRKRPKAGRWGLIQRRFWSRRSSAWLVYFRSFSIGALGSAGLCVRRSGIAGVKGVSLVPGWLQGRSHLPFLLATGIQAEGEPPRCHRRIVPPLRF